MLNSEEDAMKYQEEISEPELLPCPFCNQPAKVDFREAECSHFKDSWGIYCNHLPNCPSIFVEIDYKPNKEQIIREWNTRPLEDALRIKLNEFTNEHNRLIEYHESIIKEQLKEYDTLYAELEIAKKAIKEAKEEIEDNVDLTISLFYLTLRDALKRLEENERNN